MGSHIGRSSGGVFAHLEMMPSMDAITLAVLLLDAWVIYSNLDGFGDESIFELSFEPEVLAVQTSILVAFLYGIEFYADHKSKR